MIIAQTSARFNILSCLLYGVLTVFPIIAFVDVFSEEGTNAPIDLALLLLFILSISLLSFRIMLWFVIGKETVLMDKKELVILKKGTFFLRNEKRIPLNELTSITSHGNFLDRNSPSQLVGHFSRQMYMFRIQNVGRIRAQTKKGESFRFLDNISLEKAEELISIIHIELERLKNIQ